MPLLYYKNGLFWSFLIFYAKIQNDSIWSYFSKFKIGHKVKPTKDSILDTLKKIKPKYQKEGVDILGLFGSYAKDTQNEFSDIDIAYRLDFQKMLKQQENNSFRVLFRLESITEELQKLFKKRVDFVSDKNEKILKEIIYV